MLYDRNHTHQIVLDDTRYRPMTTMDTTAELAQCDYSYLKQRHYVARTMSHGLFVQSADMSPGWERMEALAWMEQLGRT